MKMTRGTNGTTLRNSALSLLVRSSLQVTFFFNDNALIPLNSIITVCKGAWTAEAHVLDLYCVFIYIYLFLFYSGGEVAQTTRLDVFQLWGPPGTTRSTFPVRAAVGFCAVLLSLSRRNTPQRLQNWYPGNWGGFECVRGFWRGNTPHAE